ncbi:MAG: extracellular solute-binding protein [Lachnospiraceae bacterium]|nr:extracellular solute-binding protein [Lachnospiraceae bacterium]
MSFKKKIAEVAAVAAMTAAVFYAGLADVNGTGNNEGLSLFGGRETIYFWYTDDELTDYINSAAVSFGEKEEVRVIPVLVSGSEYLEAINSASVENEQTPDAYIISNDSLEKAYLAGLAGEVNDTEGICSTEYFPKAAIDAVTYHGKIIAYPLYYETSALVYNETYIEEWLSQQEQAEVSDALPDTMSDILNFADTFDAPEGVEGILEWDVSDIFYNYWFVGNYMIVGGDIGDDKADIDINNAETRQCLEFYASLNQFFSIESDSVTYDSVVQDFIDGRTVFTIATTDIVRRLEEAKEDGSLVYDYGIATMPDITDELKSRSMSVTDAIVINGYSEHNTEANKFAAYLANECADELYAWTGKASANVSAEQTEALNIFFMEYSDSVPLPKMMETGDFWMQLEVLFAKVWNGGDAETLLNQLAEGITVN